jgi:CRISPR-associated protein Cmr1
VSGEDRPGAATESGDRDPLPAPKALPPAQPRAHRGGPTRTKVGLSVEVITPILGGGAQARELDEIDVIRPAAVRGHLRFWWRALYGHEDRFASAEALYAAESALWGRSAKGNKGGRSAVEVRIKMFDDVPAKDISPIDVAGTSGYALWPARPNKDPRRPPGTRFELALEAPRNQACGFEWLQGKTSLRDAFLDWLHTTYKTTRVAP